MNAVRADDLLGGRVALIAPHMDDEVLGCGGVVASLSDTTALRVIYATDGSRSPWPAAPWLGAAPTGLVEARRQEAIEAMAVLGVTADQLRFLTLPDSRLAQSRQFPAILASMLDELDPRRVVAPFRYDRHPDHIATHRAAARWAASRGRELIEYFVYPRWRLLPRGDIRRYIAPDFLVEVDPGAGAERKRRALDCFRTQTTRYFVWQTRPNLMPALLDAVSAAPEVFLRASDSHGMSIFEGRRQWIRVAHLVEPILKREKDRAAAVLGSFVGASSRALS